jgi:Family of unknown function (DUF695)
VAFLRRRRPAGPDGPIAAFWDWWATDGRTLAERSISGRLEPEQFAETMTARVRTLGELGWELAAGEVSEHVLVVRSEGEPESRAVARRVVLAAPDADTTWSYVDTRPPVPDPESVVVAVGDLQDVDFARVQVTARVDSGRFDVQVHHPAFADLPEEGRALVTFLALDATLGEVDTELWLGEVTPVEFPPLDGFGLTALRSVVQDLKRQRLDADGRPGWVMLRGETKQGPLLAMARSPLHPLTAPNLDTYVAVTLPYSQRTFDGLPDEGSLEPLRDFEGRLEKSLGTTGQVVAHLSNAGTRTLHVYVDSTADVLPSVKGLARSWDQGTADVHEMHDPGWSAVTHLRG